MGLDNKKYTPEQLANELFDVIMYYAIENNKAFKENVSKDYHATLLLTFFLIYGIDLVNYFLLNKYGTANKEVPEQLFMQMKDRICDSYSSKEAEMIIDCVTVMEDEIIMALKLPFDDAVNNPFYKLANYIPAIIDIRGDYDRLYANQLLFNCLGETFTRIGMLVDESAL